MFRVLGCLTGEHDLRLVLLAGFICFLASLVAVNLFHRSRDTLGGARAAWLGLAGTVTGCGIWAMHSIAMLACEPVTSAEIVPDPTRIISPFSLSPVMLALAVAAAAFAVLLTAFVGAFADRSLEQRDLQLITAVNNMSQGLLMVDSSERLIVCNDRYIEMYGLSRDIVKPGANLRDIIRNRKDAGTLARDPEEYRSTLLQAMAEGKTVSWVVESPDGRSIAVTNRPTIGGAWVGTHEDITERRRAEQRIAYLAHTDPLTDLPNRSTFNEILSSTVDQAAAANVSFAILCVDLDRFKEVNDVFGHAVGDGLLREVSRRLQAVASDAVLARLGGDEFAIIATGGPQPATAARLADLMLAIGGEDMMVDGHVLRIGISAGVAIFPDDGNVAAALMKNAEAALYRAKADGRGTARFFEAEMDKRLRERMTLQHDLRSAIAGGELSLHYQPQATIAGEIAGFEALLRWQHPEHGMVPPATFIPVAEDSGLIIAIGEWVLREACREAASWPAALQIALNLSPVQFLHGDLPALVHAILLETGLGARRLELEITEGVLINDPSRALSILRRLKALGVKIAMDDFGTGYSSLSYLQSFPFDKIKIDRAFISNLERNAQSETIVRAVIGLARGLGLPVVAEGVETEGQLAFLVKESCNFVQGFLLGRPQPIQVYAALVGRPQPVPETLASVA